MRLRRHWVLAFGCLTCSLASTAIAAPADEVAIRNIQTAQEVAWNVHDAHAYAALFTDDADVVNVFGWHWKGRAELEKKLGQAFSYVFAASRLHIDDVTIRILSSDLALAHTTWSMTGARSLDGTAGNMPQKGIQTQVLQRMGGRWRILSFQNTRLMPEQSFPTGGSPEQVKAAQPHRCLLANRQGNCLIQH